MKKLNLNIEQIIIDYNQGEGCYKLANKYQCSASTINNILKKNNVNTQKSPNEYRKYNLDENYFENIDSEDKAYFLGLLYSDGCVYKYTMNIALQQGDSLILEKFKECLEYTGKLYNIQFNNNSKPQIKLSFSNKKITSDLLKLGVVPNKSLILNFPTYNQVPKHLIRHFIRGLFDGDGTIIKRKRKDSRIEIYSSLIGSNDLIKGIFKEIKIGNIYNVNSGKNSTLTFASKKDIIYFLDYIYTDATYYIERKYKLYIDVINYLKSKSYFYSNEPIKQYSINNQLIKEWQNISEIKNNTTYNTQTILRNIRGKIKTSNGFIWKL